MKKTYLLLLVSFFAFSLSAQVWDGGGDGHSWNDAMNWDNDQVPGTTDLVEITTTGTIDGTAPNSIGRLKIGGGNKTVTLDLDLMIGNGTIAQHGILLGNKTTLIIGGNATNRTITVNVPNNKDGVSINGSVSDTTDIAELIVESNTTLNIISCDDGFNLASSNGAAKVINNGTINITGGDNQGINHQNGSFVNNGTLNINSPTLKRGIRYNINADTLMNNGTITITNVINDGLELFADDFINNGNIDITIAAAAASGDNGIVIDSSTVLTNTGMISVNAGTNMNARSIVVNLNGTLMNQGTITVTGGNVGSSFRNDGGTIMNGSCATIDIIGGRVNADAGTFTNNGLIKSSHPSGSGIFLGAASTATVTNNTFFAYENSNQFATGTGGTITDNGANVGSDTLAVDAAGTCTVSDLGVDVATDLYLDATGNTLVGTTDASGNITFPSGIFALAGLQTLYTCYGSEFIVEVSNVSGNCTAVIPTIDSVNITFTVNTNKPGFTVDAAGIFLAGGGNFGLPGDYPMTDSDNDGVYEITVRRPKGFSSFYTFTNGACTDWSCKEDISNQPCADPNNFDDRTLPAVYNDTTLSTCFAECSSDGTCATNTTRLTNDETLFSVAPTLVNNYTMITFGETVINTEKTIRLLSAVGQVVLTKTVENTNSYRLDVKNLPSGLYFINIQTADKIATKRIMIAK